jgi:hypothetical protein
MKRQDWMTAIGLTFLWCCLILITGTQGDFPLNDDWSFMEATRRWMAHGRLEPTHWTSMSLLSNVLWGSLFAKVAGLTHDALRMSSQVAGLGAGLGLFALLRIIGGTPLLACLGALSLLLNPIHFALSNTFMTDSLFLCLWVCGLAGLTHHLLTQRTWSYWAGTALVLGATASRQLGVAAAAGFAMAALTLPKATRLSVPKALMPMAACSVFLWGHAHWLSSQGLTPFMASNQSGRLLEALQNPKWLLVSLLQNGTTFLLYMALFLMPLALGALSHLRRQLGSMWAVSPWARGGCFALACVLSLGLYRLGKPMPTVGNIMLPTSIGPLTLSDVDLRGTPSPFGEASTIWASITVLCVLTLMLILPTCLLAARQLVRERKAPAEPRMRAVMLMLMATMLAYVGPLLVGGMFDRYMLPLVPLGAALLAGLLMPLSTFKPNALMAGGTLVVFGWFSVCATHDHFQWQSIRWSLIHDLERSHAHLADQLDGGFEYNAPPFYLSAPWEKLANGPDLSQMQWELAFHREPGLHTLQTRTFTSWLTRRHISVHLMARPQP